MASEPRPMRRLRIIGRFLRRALLILVGVIGFLFTFFVSQGMFSGYPQYYTGWLGSAGMSLIVLTGGAAWIIDHRRIDDDG